jgi:hypothetical protein
MTDSITDSNRLDDEASPYLAQHADNPVNWQPWDEDALDAAEEADKPIFLSIGYSACHWCHVMEDESFEDDAVAKLINENYVPIKVDREERPDLDSQYQSIAQQVSGRGGWPLSVWLTPDGRPFFVGTYFPKEERRGSPGFIDLLEGLNESWEHSRDEIEQRAEQWANAIKGQLEATPDQPGDGADATMLDTAASAAKRGADREHGGWGNGPKFPQPARLEVLLRGSRRLAEDDYQAVAAETLDAMANGGMYDQIGGGFHRYATDNDWTVPHFEKMLYDNGELARLYLEGYRATGSERYRTVAEETLDFVAREMRHEDSGFFSTLDAQSDGEEGKFYVWTPDEIEEVLDEDLADLFCDRFGVTTRGNFEGKSVLTLSESIEDLAEARDLDPETVRERLETAHEQVFEAREERVRPGRDEKVLASWNGLAISAFAQGGLTLDTDYAETGAQALEFIREHLWDAETGRLSRRYKDGDVKGTGYLDDYAFLGRGALDLYQATGDVSHLAFARQLADAIVADFWDADEGTLYYTPEDEDEPVARPQELMDQSTPASAGVAAELLAALSHFRTDDRYEEIVDRVLATHSNKIQGNPLQHASLVLAADRFVSGSAELTVVADELDASWRERIGETYLPGRLLSLRPATAEALDSWLDALALDDAPSIWADRTQIDDTATIYACRDRSCSQPLTDVDEALTWLA